MSLINSADGPSLEVQGSNPRPDALFTSPSFRPTAPLMSLFLCTTQSPHHPRSRASFPGPTLYSNSLIPLSCLVRTKKQNHPPLLRRGFRSPDLLVIREAGFPPETQFKQKEQNAQAHTQTVNSPHPDSDVIALETDFCGPDRNGKPAGSP